MINKSIIIAGIGENRIARIEMTQITRNKSLLFLNNPLDNAGSHLTQSATHHDIDLGN